MKIQKSVWAALLLIIGGFLYFLITSYQNIERNKESFGRVNRTHDVIEKINAVRSAIFNLESQTRGFAISGNSAFLYNYQQKKDDVLSQTDQLSRLIGEDNTQQKHGVQLIQLIKNKIAFQDQVMHVSQQSLKQGQALIAGLNGKHLTDSLEVVLQSMQSTETALLNSRLQHHKKLTEARYTSTLILTIAAFVLLLYILLNITRENLLRKKAEKKANESELKYRNLIENSSLVVYTTDLQGNFTYLGGKCKEYTGFTSEELLGEHFLTLVEESWKEKVKDFYSAQIEKRTLETVFEFPIISKNGELKWLEQSVNLSEEKGEPAGFQCVAKDITERKYAERLLLDSEKKLQSKQHEYHSRLQSILDNMPMIVYLKDLDGRFIMVNRQFHETFMTTDQDVIGQRDLDVHLNEESALRFLEVDEEIKKTLQPKEIRDVIITRQGERNMAIVKFPLLDNEGKLIAISAVGRDITEGMRYQQQLIEARERAEKAEQLQEEFLANMSHEIRTPMNGVIGMTNLMETTSLNGEQKEYLRLIKESSQILLMLINDILDLSKIKAGRMTVEQVDFDLHQTIESVLAPFVIKAKTKGIRFTKSIQDIPRFVNGDQHKLIQIFNNLLSNAVKFTDKGSVSLAMHTETSQDGSMVLVGMISDTGIGIKKENLDYIFNSFVQAGNDMVRRFGGTGLGLAITKRLIELQGGSITVCSEAGEGTTFRFHIPIAKSNLHPDISMVSDPQNETDVKCLLFKKILLVEDNEVNQKVTFLMLHKAGVLVDIANNGKEAIAFLEDGRQYDLIIMDLQMPEMNGYQTTQYIRNKLLLQTPIIAMTASALRNEKDKCLKLGMNEYIAKPFAPNTLFFHLKRLLFPDGEGEQKEVAAPTETVNSALYNLQFLHEMEDEEYTSEVLKLFLDKTPPVLSELDQVSAKQDWDEVFRKAHNLKSSLGLLQMNRMLECVTDIERFAKTRTNTEQITSLVSNVLQQYQLVKPMLEAELTQTQKNLS